MMQTSTEILEKNEALSKVKQDATALSRVAPQLKSDISFVWEISRIQNFEKDELRKKYVNRFLIQESLKL